MKWVTLPLVLTPILSIPVPRGALIRLGKWTLMSPAKGPLLSFSSPLVRPVEYILVQH